MGLYEKIIREREERQRGRGHPSGRDEDTGSIVFPRRPGSVSGDQSQGQRRTDLRRMRSYLAYEPKNRWEAMLLKHLKKQYPRSYLGLRNRAEKNRAEGHPGITYYQDT